MKDMHKFQVFADYHQFYLMDASIKPNIPEEVTEQDMLRRLRAAPHIVVFHTESAAHEKRRCAVQLADASTCLAQSPLPGYSA